MKLVFLFNNLASFVSHRLPIAIEARNRGYEIFVICGLPGSKSIEDKAVTILNHYNINYKRLSFTSSGTSVLEIGENLIVLYKILNNYRPDILHCITPKCILLGGLLASLLKIKKSVYAISGMGYIFTNDYKDKINIKKIIIRFVLTAYYKYILKSVSNKYVIVQNKYDQSFFEKLGYKLNVNLIKIKGSGVKLSKYLIDDFSIKEEIVLFPARVMFDKGIIEFIDAIKIVKDKLNTKWRFIVAGDAEYDNPSSVSKKLLKSWENDLIIEWIGHAYDLVNYYKKASIVCLPSYREGMPKVLLEAAASGCAIITTNTIGCNEAIIPNSTGELVNVADAHSLANKLIKFIKNKRLIEEYGINGMNLAKNEFSIESVVDAHMNIYER